MSNKQTSFLEKARAEWRQAIYAHQQARKRRSTEEMDRTIKELNKAGGALIRASWKENHGAIQ